MDEGIRKAIEKIQKKPMKKKILIAEDDKTIQKLYQLSFSIILFDVRMASDGEEALTIYREWQPDIILLDHGLPIKNGYQVLKTIRDTDKTTTIIMVTSAADKENIIACAKQNIQGYVVKPFKTGEIAQKAVQLYNAHMQTK